LSHRCLLSSARIVKILAYYGHETSMSRGSGKPTYSVLAICRGLIQKGHVVEKPQDPIFLPKIVTSQKNHWKSSFQNAEKWQRAKLLNNHKLKRWNPEHFDADTEGLSASRGTRKSKIFRSKIPPSLCRLYGIRGRDHLPRRRGRSPRRTRDTPHLTTAQT
jgi:hypothetical protein